MSGNSYTIVVFSARFGIFKLIVVSCSPVVTIYGGSVVPLMRNHRKDLSTRKTENEHVSINRAVVHGGGWMISSALIWGPCRVILAVSKDIFYVILEWFSPFFNENAYIFRERLQ